MAEYFANGERCKDISSSRKSVYVPSHNTIFLPISDALIVVGGADYVTDADEDAYGNCLLVLGELLDPVFKDEPLPEV